MDCKLNSSLRNFGTWRMLGRKLDKQLSHCHRTPAGMGRMMS